MAASACRDQNQAVHSAFQRFFSVAHGCDVMKNLASPAMGGIDDAVRGAQAGDDDGHLVLGADFQVAVYTVIRSMDDEIDGIGSDDAIGLACTQVCQRGFDFGQPWR